MEGLPIVRPIPVGHYDRFDPPHPCDRHDRPSRASRHGWLGIGARRGLGSGFVVGDGRKGSLMSWEAAGGRFDHRA